MLCSFPGLHMIVACDYFYFLIIIGHVISHMISHVTSLECFACHDLRSKFRCKTTQICNSGEVCLVQKVYATYTDQFDKEHQSIFYNMACKKREQCLNKRSTGENFTVKSQFLSSCCCSDRCLEEDGTGYGDYTHCYNALTYEEARKRTGSATTTTCSTIPRVTIILAALITYILFI